MSTCYFLAHCPLQVQYPFSAASPKACSLLVWSASVLTLYGLLCVYLLAVFSKLQLHHRNSCNYLLVSYVIVWRAGMYNVVGEDFIAELIWISCNYLYKLAATRCNQNATGCINYMLCHSFKWLQNVEFLQSLCVHSCSYPISQIVTELQTTFCV